MPEPGVDEFFADANCSDSPHPWLGFSAADGKFVIADDYEASNDITARDFTISKQDAVSLAMALLRYVQGGRTSAVGSNSAVDVEDAIRNAS